MPERGPMFVRVKDKSTRHEFDVPENDPRIGYEFEAVKEDRYPPVVRPRITKYFKQPVRAKQKEAESG